MHKTGGWLWALYEGQRTAILLLMLLTIHFVMKMYLIVASLDVVRLKVAQVTPIVQILRVGMTRTPPQQVAKQECLDRMAATLSEPAQPRIPTT